VLYDSLAATLPYKRSVPNIIEHAKRANNQSTQSVRHIFAA